MHPSETKTRRVGRKTIVLVAVALVLSALTVYTFYNINGHSFDVTNREVRLIITDSMEGEPTSYDVATIEKDSLVMVRFLSDEEKYDLKQGDVVQFNAGSILNHHRVVENHPEEGYVITKGDNNPANDRPVYYADIRGEVVGSDHMAGEIFTFVKNYYLVIIAAIVVLYIGSLLIEEIRREKKEEKSQ